MGSVAWAFRERIRAEQAAKDAKAAIEKAGQTEITKMAENKANFELLLAQLDIDCKRLSEQPQGAARDPLKRELVKSYLPLVNAYIAGKEAFQNLVLTQVMVWLFDLGEIEQALTLADVAIAQNQPMPQRFGRDVRTFVADAFLDWRKLQKALKNPVEPYFTRIFDQVMTWKIHDEIKVKYLKAAAEEYHAAGEVEKALECCDKAQAIDPTVPVKTLRKELEKAVAEKAEKLKHKQAKPGSATKE